MPSFVPNYAYRNGAVLSLRVCYVGWRFADLGDKELKNIVLGVSQTRQQLQPREWSL